MLHVLTSPAVVDATQIPMQWSVPMVLNHVAHGKKEGKENAMCVCVCVCVLCVTLCV